MCSPLLQISEAQLHAACALRCLQARAERVVSLRTADIYIKLSKHGERNKMAVFSMYNLNNAAAPFLECLKELYACVGDPKRSACWQITPLYTISDMQVAKKGNESATEGWAAKIEVRLLLHCRHFPLHVYSLLLHTAICTMLCAMQKICVLKEWWDERQPCLNYQFQQTELYLKALAACGAWEVLKGVTTVVGVQHAGLGDVLGTVVSEGATAVRTQAA